MDKIQELNGCGRGEQLVAYLYGESGADERAAFEGHLAACAACRAELSAFGQVREAVGAWRAELLTRAPAVSAAELIPVAATHAREDSIRAAHGGAIRVARDASRSPAHDVEARRSPWAALREFFALSPAWLRYGSAAAALVVCALAALAVANARVSYSNGSFAFSTGWSRDKSADAPQPPATENAQDASARLGQLVAERDAARRELEETRAQLEDSRASNIDAVYREIDEAQPDDAQPEDATQSAPAGGSNAPRSRRGATTQRRPTRRAPKSEDDLPRLLDLLSSGN